MSIQLKTYNDGKDLVLTCLFDAPRSVVFKALTDPAMLKQWFVPRPWTIAVAETDVRVGGITNIVMKSPEGDEFPARGVYLEVIPDEKIVTTDAYTEAWIPSEKPFFTCVITLKDENGKTRYTATARHWNDADREAHEKMGFHEGWGQCAQQLAELLAA